MDALSVCMKDSLKSGVGLDYYLVTTIKISVVQ